MENVVPDTNEPASLKTRDYYVVLGFFMGVLGIHNFYAGRYKTAIIQALVTFCLFGTGVAIFVVYIWVIFKIFMVSRDGRNAVVSKGLYDSRRQDNGGGYHVVFDRDKQRTYFRSSPR